MLICPSVFGGADGAGAGAEAPAAVVVAPPP